MSHRLIKPGAALFGVLALTLAGCSDGNGPSTTTSNALSTAQVQDVGQDVAEDISDITDASMYNTSTGVSISAVVEPGVRINTPPPACVTLSPANPTNSDGDLVPDSVRFTYDCGFLRAGGQIIDSLFGSIDFIDPLPAQTSVGVKHVFTNFTRQRLNTPFPLRSFRVVQNGTRQWGGNADTLGHTITNFTSAWTHLATGRVTTHTKNWTAKFTATTPGTIALGIPLPAGTLSLLGNSTWTTASRSWSVQTTTTVPLTYDPSCQVTPRFTAGTVDLVVSRNGTVTNVEIVFSACGTYTVTKTPGTV